MAHPPSWQPGWVLRWSWSHHCFLVVVWWGIRAKEILYWQYYKQVLCPMSSSWMESISLQASQHDRLIDIHTGFPVSTVNLGLAEAYRDSPQKAWKLCNLINPLSKLFGAFECDREWRKFLPRETGPIPKTHSCHLHNSQLTLLSHDTVVVSTASQLLQLDISQAIWLKSW